MTLRENPSTVPFQGHPGNRKKGIKDSWCCICIAEGRKPKKEDEARKGTDAAGSNADQEASDLPITAVKKGTNIIIVLILHIISDPCTHIFPLK